MKVAIFETEHFEAAYPLVRLFDNGRNEISLFCYPYAKRQLEYMLEDSKGRYDWIIKKDHQSRLSFVRTIYREVKKKKIELLYLNTVSDNFPAYAILVKLLPNVRVILTVHAINNFFITKNKYLPKKLLAHWGKKWLRSVVREFNVLLKTMTPALEQKLPAGKIIHHIPGSVYEEAKAGNEVRSLQNPVRIVVPGSIDDRRRNYDQVFDLLILLQKEDIPISVTFAGTFYGEYGERILARCKGWSAKQQQLIYYEKGPVDQPAYDRIMQKADLIFTPSVTNTVIDGVNETYGLTISSGNIADVVRYAKPFIIPSSLVIDPVLEKACLRYQSISDISDFILLTHEDTWIYQNLAKAARAAAIEYTIEEIRRMNAEAGL